MDHVSGDYDDDHDYDYDDDNINHSSEILPSTLYLGLKHLNALVNDDEETKKQIGIKKFRYEIYKSAKACEA